MRFFIDATTVMTNQSADKKNIIVVLGAGRTGTSLLTKILLALGMSESERYISATKRDPDGFHEDADIVSIHKKILSVLESPPTLAIGDEEFANPALSQYIDALADKVRENVHAALTVWGFKDPRTATLLPLWKKVFVRENIHPLFILPVRDPAPTIISMNRQSKKSESFYELMWLQRNVEALYRTNGHCFIVHYEDWFSPDKALAVATELLQYTGLDTFRNKNTTVTEALSGKIKTTLNRSVEKSYSVQNRYVLQLYKQLQACSGECFDRKALLDVVAQCRRAMDEFSGWAQEAKRFFKQCDVIPDVSIDWELLLRKRDEKEMRLSTLAEKKKIFDGEIPASDGGTDPLHESIEEANTYLQECIDLSDTNTNLQIRVSVQAKELIRKQNELERYQKELQALRMQQGRTERELNIIQTSTSFKIGRQLVAAVAEPGKNTLLLPFYLLRTVFSSKTPS